jgi:hypothetical protein
MASLASTKFSAVIVVAISTPVLADNLALITEGAVVQRVLSDGLSTEPGHWQSKVQLVFDSKSQRITRRIYEYFDPAPSRSLDVVWYPKDEGADKPGRITGEGRLVWRQRDRAGWDPTSVVAVFTGEMRSGRPNGTGELTTNDGLVYTGVWKNGRANGVGHLKLPSGDEYSGTFQNGLANGKGREFEVTGEVFEGTFHDGLRHGKGKTRLPSGFSYDSEWTNGAEGVRSRRIRVAQMGGPTGVRSGEDVRMAVSVLQRPRLPDGVGLDQVVPYSSVNDGDKIKIEPADRRLMSVWKGSGELQTSPGDSPVRAGIFNIDSRYIDAVPPTFILGFENHSSQSIVIQSLRLDVLESNSDNQPAIQMMNSMDNRCAVASFSVEYDLENFGWAPAKGAQMRFSFGSAPQVTKPIGELVTRKHIDFSEQLQQFHVDVARLRRQSDQGFPCPSGSVGACLASLRSNPLFGTLGPQLRLNDVQIVVPAVGRLDYTWTDNKSASHNRSSPFHVDVGLGKFKQQAECGEGAAPAPTRVNAFGLQLDAANYTVPVPFQRTIAAGQMARFTLPIAAAKSSNHTFRIIATLSDGHQVASLPIQLLYFHPRVLP